MYRYWTAHLETQDEKERFEKQIKSAYEVLGRLKDIIDIKEKELTAAERHQSAYETPNWAFLQAHRNGYASAMNSIKTLLTLDQQKQ